MRVLIAGGGISGLTAALCFARRGDEVAIFEQAPDFDEVGAGLQLSPNAMRVFRFLGLENALAMGGFAPDFAEMRMGQSGRQIFQFPLGKGDAAQKRWGAPYLHIHRADLVTILRAALEQETGVALHTNARVEQYEDHGGAISLRLESGAQYSGDLLIGADGIHSAIRTQMLGPDQPRFTGNIAWRGTASIEALGQNAPEPNATIWLGRGKHAVTYRLKGGTLANFVGVVERSEWQSESWSVQGAKAEALADFSGWHPIVQTLVEASPRLFRWGLFDRLPLQRWTDGRAVLLGDACHPMLPFMAQGAGQAVEDAFVLARLVEEGATDIPNALRLYATRRQPRTSKVQAISRSNASLFHHRAAPKRLATYGPIWLAGRFAPRAIMARQDWLYGHDVTT